jgi:hypothetical protein
MKFGKRALFLIFSFTMISAAQGAALSDDEGFHFKELSTLIQTRHFTTIEQLLPNLPAEMRKNYVLMYHSNSRHRGASLAQPRIVMFNDNASMIIAVAGSADQVNGNSLEVIENVGPQSKFTFHQIQFSKDGLTSANVNGDASSCVACHRQNPGPNWDNYPSWPGAYGSSALFDNVERSGFTSFIESIRAKDPKMARYRSLSMDENTSLELFESNNHIFSNYIGELNKQRIILAFKDAMRKNSKLRGLRVPMAMLSAGCTQDASSIVPAEYRSKLTETFKDYEARISAETIQHMVSDAKVSYQLASGLAPSSDIGWQSGSETPYFNEVKPFLGIGYLMKYAMNLDPQDFSVSVEAYVDHPSSIESASVYNSNDSFLSIQDDLLGENLSMLSCDELKSRLPN